jgi:CheY-like chemotaxis protein
MGTIEMVSSHLRRLGATTRITTKVEDLTQPFGSNEFIILDYDFLIKNPDAQTAITNISDMRVIVLSLLTMNISLPKLAQWTSVTKPVTLSSIYDGAAKFISESSIPKNRLDASQPGHETNSRTKILVAEDVEINQKIATEMLQLLDFEVEIAENGEVAFQKYKSGSHVLVFMDCQMPVLDGFEATIKIREFEKQNGLPSIPIIALTAGISADDKERCLNSGMDDYLTKPFSISELRESILKLDKRIQRRIDHNEFQKESFNNSDREKIRPIALDSDIFNLRAINNIREVEQQTGRILIPSILDGYTNQMHQKLAEITLNFKDGDHEKIYRTAHAIKSMSANIGAEKVRTISADIEAKGRSGELVDGAASFALLDTAYNEFVQEFESRFIN